MSSLLNDPDARRPSGEPAAADSATPMLAAPAGDAASKTLSASDIAPRTPAALPPVPGYEVLEEVGRGGMGVVYKARQLGFNRIVALKMILSGSHGGAEERERFRIEAEAVARLQHPNIVQVHEVGEHDGRPFFSMEFCPGGGLDRKLHAAPLPPAEAAALVETLARAVHAAHQANVVHRDLKTSNVLLAADGAPKVADFGLAKKIGATQLTQSGAVMGTPSYMAPEQARGNSKAIGPAADIYALGAILYELLTGRPPFKAASPLDTILQVAADEPVPPRRLQPKTPRDLETICLKCLAKAPGKRYGTAEDLAEDLRRFRGGEPVAARPAGVAERGWRWCRRKPAAATACGLGVLLVLALVVTPALFAAYQARSAESLAKEQKKTLAALGESQAATRRAEGAERDARRQAAESTLERALQMCEQGEAGRGLLWLARGLEMAHEAKADDLEEAYRWNLGAWGREVHSLEMVLPHPDAVYAAAFSPDDKVIATGCQDGKVRLWDADTGRQTDAVFERSAAVLSLSFRPDGRRLAAGYRDGFVCVWDLASGEAAVTFRYQSGDCPDWMFPAVAFSPDGRLLLTGSAAGGTATLWDADTGRPAPIQQSDIPAAYVEGVGFSPDGNRALTGNSNWDAQIWDVASGEPISPPVRTGGRNTCAVFSPDGKTFITGHLQDESAQVWDVATGQPAGPRLRHQHAVRAVAYSPDGALVATGSDDTRARLWDVTTGQPVGGPLPHLGAVHAVAFRSDGMAVLTASEDGAARVWKVAPGVIRNTLPCPSTVKAAAFSPDGARLATGTGDMADPATGGAVIFWDPESGKPDDAVLAHPGDWVSGVAFTPDGKTLFTATGLGERLRRWDLATRQLVWVSPPHGEQILHMALSPDGATLATGSYSDKPAPDGRNARLWDAATGQLRGRILQHADAVWGLTFTRDGKALLTGSEDRTTRLWDAATGLPLDDPVRHPNGVSAVAFSPDGKTVLTAGGDQAAQQWDPLTWKPIGSPMFHQGPVNLALYSPDGRLIVTTGADRTTRIWHAGTAKQIGPALPANLGAPPALAVSGAPTALAVSPDGKRLATGHWDKKARLWAMPEPAVGDIEPLRGWAERITGMELDHGGAIHILDPDAWRQREPFQPVGRQDDAVKGWGERTGKVAARRDGNATAVRPPRSFVCVASPDDPTERVIFSSPDRWQCPVWAPDGKALFCSSGDKLYRLPLSGGPPQYFPIKGASPEGDYAFSADGGCLAFTSGDAIYVLPAFGEAAPILPRKSGFVHGWSPDGKKVLYTTRRDNGRWVIYSRPTDRGEETRLLAYDGFIDAPDYSPDGKWIYFSCDKSRKPAIWRMPAEGAGPAGARAEQVTNDGYRDWFPHPSPDGKWLLFLSCAGPVKGAFPENQDVVLRLAPLPADRPEAGPIRELVRLTGGRGTINAPCWSPDGKRFAYIRYAPDAP